MIQEMIKLVHEDTSATHVDLTNYFKAICLLIFQNSTKDWKDIHELMNHLLFYANPEVVLEVEDPHLLRNQFKDNCMDLVHANMELVTLCTECHTELKVTEDHGIIVEPRLADITKEMNKIVPKMWSLEKLVKKKLT